jgi:hypothetical protein
MGGWGSGPESIWLRLKNGFKPSESNPGQDSKGSSGCRACGGGDRWIKTCLTEAGSRVRLCDGCWESLQMELGLVVRHYDRGG